MSLLLLVAMAPAALAAISGIGRGEVVRDHRTIEISADYGDPSAPDYVGPSAEHQLTLTDPVGQRVTVSGGGLSGTLRYTFDTRCWKPGTLDAGCVAQPQLAPNGSWTITQTGSNPGVVSFRLLIPPDPPTSVTAIPASAKEMRVSWRRGAEPDLRSFTVLEGNKAVQAGLAASGEGRVCDDSGGCSTVISYEGPGAEHTYTVVAFRSDGTPNGLIASAPSGPASGRLVGDPLASPPSDPTDVPGTITSPGASASPSPTTKAAPKPGTRRDPKPLTLSPDAGARRQAFASGFNAFGPKLGIPKLPPLPESQQPSVALPDGTFERELGYDDQVLTEEQTELGADEQGVRGAVGSLVDSERLAKSTAGALVLLLTGAHLRRWLGDTSAE